MISQRFWPLTIWTVLLTSLAFAFVSFVSGEGHNLLSASRFLLKEFRRWEELNTQEETVRRNEHGKLRVAQEVIAGRMTLRQAADEFEAMRHEQFGDRYEILLNTVREARCSTDLRHEVIGWVQISLQGKPAQAAAVLGRLEKECPEEVRGEQFAHGS